MTEYFKFFHTAYSETGLATVTVGSVNGLQFFGNTHLFSFSEDGTIAIWKAGSWECLRTLKGHK